MPRSYSIDPERGLGSTVAFGIVTEDEVLKGVRAAYADPQCHPDLRLLHDYSRVVDWRFATEFLARMAATCPFSKKSRTAVWAVGSLNCGMIRAYQTRVENGQIKIFTDWAAAAAWLNGGVPPETQIT